jgi:hypothetical protein
MLIVLSKEKIVSENKEETQKFLREVSSKWSKLIFFSYFFHFREWWIFNQEFAKKYNG